MNADLCFGFSKTKWEALSLQLDGNEVAWAEAIGVFERRMRERFFGSIDALVADDTKPDVQPSGSTGTTGCIPGFSIVALCCLLIETLQGFREGPPSTAAPTGQCTFPSAPCIKPSSGTNQQFIKFLHRPAFGGAFNGKAAKEFTSGIRNGILHEAETRKWVIWREEPEGKIADAEDDGFALNRSLFYAAIEREFESYLTELRNPANGDLRKRFKNKMDELCKRA
ncbi:MAG TPA: hypothetical protein VEU96_30565 [Bryobacteraceae bacterium]|nr:hypothetical protein [Bryobacteraceae bacterium]